MRYKPSTYLKVWSHSGRVWGFQVGWSWDGWWVTSKSGFRSKSFLRIGVTTLENSTQTPCPFRSWGLTLWWLDVQVLFH